MIVTFRHPPAEGYRWTEPLLATAVGRPLTDRPGGEQIGTVVAARLADDGAAEFDVKIGLFALNVELAGDIRSLSLAAAPARPA